MDNFFVRIKSDKQYKEMILDSLCRGITETSDFRDILEYVIDTKISMFDIPEFENSLYDGDDDEVSLLILPSVRRVYGKIFVDYPSIFKNQEHHILTTIHNKRLELYQLLFDIDEFIEYLINMLLNNKQSLKNFEFLDKTAETLSLIVDNYIAMLITKVTTSTDLNRDIRDMKLKKIVK